MVLRGDAFPPVGLQHRALRQPLPMVVEIDAH
jgi:hypothetical protein